MNRRLLVASVVAATAIALQGCASSKPQPVDTEARSAVVTKAQQQAKVAAELRADAKAAANEAAALRLAAERERSLAGQEKFNANRLMIAADVYESNGESALMAAGAYDDFLDRNAFETVSQRGETRLAKAAANREAAADLLESRVARLDRSQDLDQKAGELEGRARALAAKASENEQAVRVMTASL